MTSATPMVEAARAVMQSDGCGFTVEGEHVFCDDRRVSIADGWQETCACKAAAEAAVNAYLSAATPAPSTPVAEGIVELLRDQIAHVRLGLDCRMPNTDSAVRELIVRADEAASTIASLSAERDGLRAANQKLHRRCQQSEAVAQATLGQLSSWLVYLNYPPKTRRARDRYLVGWIIRDIKRIAERLQSRASLKGDPTP